jgi:DNA topoisomerase II
MDPSNYKSLTQTQHVLKRPNVYIGSVSKTTTGMWLFKDDKMVFEDTEYIPGLLKLFEEIIENALDHSLRKIQVPVTEIRIDITDDGIITVRNNGSGIPIELNSDGIYIPESIFGNLLTGSNYNDAEDRYLVGTNGLGSKLTGIFSEYLKLELVTKGTKYVQKFTDSLQTRTSPKVSQVKSADYTQVTFKLNVEYFKVPFPRNLFISRAYLLIPVLPKGTKLKINGKTSTCKDLKTFCKDLLDIKKVINIENNDWKLIVSLSETENGRCLSFVNGSVTTQHGKHLDYVLQTISKELKKKKHSFTSSELLKSMDIFLIASINRPEFSSQTKDLLTTIPSNFGKKLEITDTFIASFMKSDIFKALQEQRRLKESLQFDKSLSKNDGKKKSNVRVPKLDDAVCAGTKRSRECTLYLTEGDSAKTFAVSGFSVIKRDLNGVFPLKGKLLNVLCCSKKQLIENEEINNIKKIVGLEVGKKYTQENLSDLRYGRITILTDADTDGSHITGLVFNFIYHFWPELIQMNFVSVMKTPLIKCEYQNTKYQFYTEKDFHIFSDGKKVSKVKYYKGLGTSTAQEAKEIFKNLKKNLFEYSFTGEKCKNSILKAFGKVNNRKEWISNYNVNDPIDVGDLTIDSFINTELIVHSVYDNLRSIPDLIDGLKPSQRKILNTVLKKNITTETKVAQLGALSASLENYHHGEASLFGAIIALAQDYPGSNNMNLLEPCGQFGSRLVLGKDSASPRYIFTRLNENTKRLFLKEDLDPELIDYLVEENQTIEPRHFVPTMPIVLINGALGIGTGYSTFVPQFNPKDVAENIRLLLEKKQVKKLVPWYRGFKGTVTENLKGEFHMECTPKRLGTKKFIYVVDEIPLTTGITQFKDLLEDLSDPMEFKIIKNDSTENSVYFELQFGKEQSILDLQTKFKMVKKIQLDNMVLFHQGKLQKFKDPNDILKIFLKTRLTFVKKKKELLLRDIQRNIDDLENLSKFIRLVVDESILINKKTKKEITEQCEYQSLENIPKLLKVPIDSFSKDAIQELDGLVKNKRSQKDLVFNKTVKDFILNEINFI